MSLKQLYKIIQNYTLRDFPSQLLSFLTLIMMVFGFLSVLLNFYVIFLLWFTEKYSIEIPNMDFNGTYTIIIFLMVLLASLLFYVFKYKNLILSLMASSMLFTVGHFIYSSLKNNADDFGVVVKNRFFHVYYNFTLDEKLAWISRLEKELNTKINFEEGFLNNMHSYKECKTRIYELLEEQKRQLQQPVEEVLNNPKTFLEVLSSWLCDPRIITALILLLATMLIYLRKPQNNSEIDEQTARRVEEIEKQIEKELQDAQIREDLWNKYGALASVPKEKPNMNFQELIEVLTYSKRPLDTNILELLTQRLDIDKLNDLEKKELLTLVKKMINKENPDLDAQDYLEYLCEILEVALIGAKI